MPIRRQSGEVLDVKEGVLYPALHRLERKGWAKPSWGKTDTGRRAKFYEHAAFYGGTKFGKHRLAPSLSPKKSVEGSLFGIVGSAVAGAIAAHWLPGMSYLAGAGAAAILGLVGQAGDLIESALKRTAGQKDSSGLLPGHGGILDRIDAHLPAGAILYAALRAGWLG